MLRKFLFSLLLTFPVSLPAQECLPGPLAFTEGEKVSYNIVYKWGLIWLDAGAVTFTAGKSSVLNQEVFHLVGEGGSYPKYDWIYRVRDRYESWVNPQTLKPLKFRRKVDEGGRFFIEESLFTKDKVYVLKNDPKKELFRDTIDLEPCTFDPISAVYFARCIDFSNREIGDKIPLRMFIDKETTPVYIRYMGKENFEMPDGSVFRTIKFKPLLIEGTIFKGGEHMTVWVTDDENRLPVYIESSILIGTVRAILTGYEGLKFPMDCKEE